MKFLTTAIEGVILIEPRLVSDERGFFMDTWDSREFAAAGIPVRFVQDSQSHSSKWTLRGMHMQVAHTQGKLMRVIAGAVYDVVVDLRRRSPSFGRWWATELSEDNHRTLWVPPGLAHGMLVTSSFADFTYKCTDIYSPADERTLAWNDAELGIEWPLPPGVPPKLSVKDHHGRSFADIEKFE